MKQLLSSVHPALLKIVIACSLLAGALAGYGAWKYSQTAASPEVRATRASLSQAAERLATADQKGDRATAAAMMDSVNVLLEATERNAGVNPAMRLCQLAAAHLADGVLSVYQGGTWAARSRYESAVTGCA